MKPDFLQPETWPEETNELCMSDCWARSSLLPSKTRSLKHVPASSLRIDAFPVFRSSRLRLLRSYWKNSWLPSKLIILRNSMTSMHLLVTNISDLNACFSISSCRSRCLASSKSPKTTALMILGL